MWQRIADTTILAGVSILIFGSCCLPEAPQILKLAPWLSIEVEEYFHPTKAFVDQSKWARLPSRVGDQLLRVVDLLEEGNVQATFFVLAWVAESNFPIQRLQGSTPLSLYSRFDWGLPFNVNLSEFARGVWCVLD